MRLNQYRIQYGKKIVFILETDDSDIRYFIPLAVYEQYSGRAKQIEAFE